MTGYKLATLQTPNGPRAAALIGELAYEADLLSGDARYASIQNILDNWEQAHATLERASRDPGCPGIPIDRGKLLAPLPKPHAIYCAGANYRAHAEEMSAQARRQPDTDLRAGELQPWFFLKSPHSVVPSGAALHVTQYARAVDWEAELVVIIGRKARNVTVDRALDFVAGYTCGNDLSARDQAFRAKVPEDSPFRADWMRHKSFDDACPMGPWMLPASYISDPMNLPIRLWVNGVLKQDSNSRHMIFSAAEQISYLSESITLYPGDVIMTGTPAGVGASRGEFLKSGDVVRIEVGEIGTIENVIK